MQELIDKVRELVAFELERANTIHPPKFNSMHEAYAVILEEVDEVREKLETIQWILHEVWFEVRCDRPKEEIDEYMVDMEKKAIHLAAEAIQVSAMCRKARM